MEHWENPPIIKIYEAIGSIADGRIEIVSDTEAKVFSSSGNKYYVVLYDPKENAIFANDNGSHWRGYLGYPSIAFLIKQGIVKVDDDVIGMLGGYAWKDINQKFKNDFDKTEQYIRKSIEDKGFDLKELDAALKSASEQIVTLNIGKLKSNLKPPKGY